jgi:hypothetical protein
VSSFFYLSKTLFCTGIRNNVFESNTKQRVLFSSIAKIQYNQLLVRIRKVKVDGDPEQGLQQEDYGDGSGKS